MEDITRQIVTFCRLCEITYQTTFSQTVCAVCKHDLEEIGWTEQNGS